MIFPFTYKRKLVLPTDNPTEYSEKLLNNFCIVLNKERKCKAEQKGNTIEFAVNSCDLTSWRVFSFINTGKIGLKYILKGVEVDVTLDTTLSALVILVISAVFAVVANIGDGHLNIREAFVSLIYAWSFLYFGNRLVSVIYFNSLLKITYKNIS